MTTAPKRPRRNRRGGAMLALALGGSVALHGLAIASLIGWPSGSAPDEAPQIIAVGMVFAERQAESASEEIAQEINTVDQAIDTISEDDRTGPVEPVAIRDQPVPAFVEGTQLTLPAREAEREPQPAPEPEAAPPPDPPIFFDEGTQLAERTPDDFAPVLPARRPPTPIAFQRAEPRPAAPNHTPPDAQPAPSTDNQPATQPAEQPSQAAPSAAATMAIQPALYAGPGLANPGPEYPRSARRRGDEGTVVLRVLVSAAGLPDSVHLLSSSGFQSLDTAAAEAVRGWRFIPARRGDVAVPATVDVPIAFRLTND